MLKFYTDIFGKIISQWFSIYQRIISVRAFRQTVAPGVFGRGRVPHLGRVYQIPCRTLAFYWLFPAVFFSSIGICFSYRRKKKSTILCHVLIPIYINQPSFLLRFYWWLTLEDMILFQLVYRFKLDIRLVWNQSI